MATTNFVNGSTLSDDGWFNDADALIYEGLFPAGIANLRPDANDGAAIGISGTAWSDIFLATGAVIDFGAGNYTITHSAGLLGLNKGFNVCTSSGVMHVGGTAALDTHEK